MDSYDAVYNAVRQQIQFCDAQLAVGMATRDAFSGASYAIEMVKVAAEQAFWDMGRPSVLYRPRLFIDGNLWCALYGDNLQDGVAGFGDSPSAAMLDFDKQWEQTLRPQA